MIDEAMSAVDAMDPTEQIKTIEKRGEELEKSKKDLEHLERTRKIKFKEYS